MARLETQIDQIYLVHPEGKKVSLVLHEEQINNSLHLYVLAELFGMQKKSEANDLKKISEIILQSFRGNKKLPAETLFEASLSQINQNLADLAHEGRKSWVGKFSCLICVTTGDNNIYLTNNGQTSAWLKRKSNLMEILPAEKRGTHPLKSFNNFTQGKLTDKDSLILITSSIFNYVSAELFSKLLDRSISIACDEISKILKASMDQDQAFCGLFLNFSKQAAQPAAAAIPEEEIYAPKPEELEELTAYSHRFRFSMPTLPSFKFALPTALNFDFLKKFQWQFFRNLSLAGKFFFTSFIIFLLLFLINIGSYGLKLRDKKAQERIATLVEKVNTDLGEIQSALIYKDEEAAIAELMQAELDLEELKKLDPAKAEELVPKVEQAKVQINKVNTVMDLKVHAELKRHPLYLSGAPSGFLLGNQDSNSLTLYDGTLRDYFLLNSLNQPISSVAYYQPAGVVVSAGRNVSRIEPTLKQFETVTTFPQDIGQLRSFNNALYALSQSESKIYKIINSKGSYSSQVSISGDFKDARDFGGDKDIYLLYPDKIIKYVGAAAQAFPLPRMSETMTNANKIFVGANLYVLESNKKRLLIITKNGSLVNQIYFPQANTPTDFYIDEPQRNFYLLDDNKLYKITF